MKPTIVRLSGGLGNQLFMYAAGIYLSEVLGHNVVFDVVEVSPRSKFNSHGSSIMSLNLEIPHLDFESRCSQTKRQIATILGDMPGNALNLVIGANFKPVSTGFSGLLFDVPRGARVQGFFQTYFYADKVVNLFPERRELIRNPSNWLVHEIYRAEDQNPLMVHLRRGDYTKAPDRWGLLSSCYYQNAIDKALVDLGERPIWVFSDDTSLAKSVFVNLQKRDIRFVEAPMGNDPAEELALMALGEGNVIANSTFSWWSAKINSSARAVIAPAPWFRQAETPRGLLPKHWKTVPAEWQ